MFHIVKRIQKTTEINIFPELQHSSCQEFF